MSLKFLSRLLEIMENALYQIKKLITNDSLKHIFLGGIVSVRMMYQIEQDTTQPLLQGPCYVMQLGI